MHVQDHPQHIPGTVQCPRTDQRWPHNLLQAAQVAAYVMEGNVTLVEAGQAGLAPRLSQDAGVFQHKSE